MTFPKQIQQLIEAFERLPGIGPKTAERLSFYLLNVPQPEIRRLGDAVLGLKEGIVFCSICKNISASQVCEIDEDKSRDHSTICVVESALDVFSLERTGQFHGVYHVLHGVINPLQNIGPEELFIDDLVNRVAGMNEEVEEVILAMNPTMEGEATAMYITRQLNNANVSCKLTRLGVGVPIGGDLQYADETTLTRALQGRRDVR